MFENYRDRLSFYGDNHRSAIITESNIAMEACFADSTAYTKVVIKNYLSDPVTVDARFISDVKDTMRSGVGNYRIQFREGFTPVAGSYACIENSFGETETWLLVSISDDVIFPKHIIKRCNYLLKWKNSSGEIIERWVAFDDSYKLYAGVSNNSKFTTVTPYSTQTILLPYDPETINIRRDNRFLIDDADVEGAPDAYIVTNRNVVTKSKDKHGVIALALSQHQYNHETDNRELMIADYYSPQQRDSALVSDSKYSLKISYSGDPTLKMTNRYKNFSAEVFDENGNSVDSNFEWSVDVLPELSSYFLYEANNSQFKIKAAFNEAISGTSIKLRCACAEFNCESSLIVKVVSVI